jgi:hypothetical protein
MRNLSKSHVQEIASTFIRRAGVDIGAKPIPKDNGGLHWSGASLRHERAPRTVAAFRDASRDGCGKNL